MRKSRGAESGSEITARLVRGDKAAWDAFVGRYNPVVFAAVRKVLARGQFDAADINDVTQDVFVRLCKEDFRLIRRYEPDRAALSTWLTVVATSTALDFVRKKRAVRVALDDLPEEVASVDPVEPQDKLKIPDGLLSPRQALVMELIFERDMDVAEAASLLGVNPQTVRSTQHKALVKLRRHFEAVGRTAQG
ncbi:MAG: sigma-70 family RNA polymerase sigma factor [Alphaproteobacteria bacterium]|nr:sigma-70 family RNA polymerase sigma factor [Alphaproteobacteria bacterium]